MTFGASVSFPVKINKALIIQQIGDSILKISALGVLET